MGGPPAGLKDNSHSRVPKRPLLALLAVLWVLALGWLAARSDQADQAFGLRGRQNDYYNSLVEGIRSGHLSLNQKVDPDLLSADPAIRQRAASALDAALYHGKYYLYYGVVPAVTLLLPYSLITGGEMGLEVACLLFLALGVLASTVWLSRALAERQGDQALRIAAFVALLVVPGTTYLADRGSFYDLPVAAGYAFSCLFWLCAQRVEAEPGRRGWLAGASLCFGLMVGCRPNLIFYAPVLVWLGLRAAQGRRPTSAAVAGIAPAAAIGAALAWYNQARFHSMLDFGFSHGVNSFFASGNPIASLRFITANLRWYLFTAPRLLPSFPFLFPIGSEGMPPGYSNAEAMQGFVAVTALTLVAAGGLLAGPRKPSSLGAHGRGLIIALGFATAVEMFFVCLLGIRASRYAVDFLTPLAFLLALMLARQWRPGASGALFRVAIAAALGAVALENTLGAIQQFDRFKFERPDSYRGFSEVLNPHERLAESLGAPKAGPVEFHLTFHKARDVQVLTLLKTGVTDYSDALRVTVYPWGYLSVDMVHERYGASSSSLIPIVFERPYTLRASMGSLYPARDDPYWNGVDRPIVDHVAELGVAWLDGNEVLSFERPFYPGTPGPRTLGPAGAGAADPTDSVTLHSESTGLPLPPELLRPPVYPAALYSLSVLLPPVDRSRTLPLVCCGRTSDGALLFIDPVPHERYRLGFDRWGSPAVLFSLPFDTSTTAPTNFKVLVGPAVAHDAAFSKRLTPAERSTLNHSILLWVNGAFAGRFPVSGSLDSFRTIVVGKNKIGFSTACDDIGAIDSAPETDALRSDFVTRLRAVLGDDRAH